MKGKLLIAAIMFAFSISSANAQTRHRSANQKHRITQGVKSGELTRSETKNLIEDKKDIHHEVALAKSDGKVTRGERRIITKDQNKESREIYRKKHNGRVRS